MFWRVFVVYALTGMFKYNFVGDKLKLMELIGCLVSTSIEKVHVSYQSIQEIDTSLEIIECGIWPDGEIFVKTRKVIK